MKEYFGYFLIAISVVVLYSGLSLKGRWINLRHIICLLPLLYSVPSSIPKGSFDFNFFKKVEKKEMAKTCFNSKEKAVIIAIITSSFIAFYQKRDTIFKFLSKNAFITPLILITLFFIYEKINNLKTEKWL